MYLKKSKKTESAAVEAPGNTCGAEAGCGSDIEKAMRNRSIV